MMRTARLRVAWLMPSLLLLSACGLGGSPSSGTGVPAVAQAPGLVAPAPGASASPAPASKIAHVIFIVQENRTFDNLFDGYPGANTATYGLGPGGKHIALRTGSLDEYWDPNHTLGQFLLESDGGRQDGFEGESYELGVGAPSPNPPSIDWPYMKVMRSQTTEYWTLAKQYALADEMFQSNKDSSYVAHQYLIAAYAGRQINLPSREPWGCDAPAGTTSTILEPNGTLEVGPFPCVNYTTLGDKLDAGGISWKYYSPALNTRGGMAWSAFDAIRHIRYGPDWAKTVSPETTVLSDVANGKLPQMSWVIPALQNSDHALGQSTTGPAWVGSVVNAVLASKLYANNTAIFITWDDWGGWYDHVAPPYRNVYDYGMRVPLIVVSAYAKHGYVSHVRHDFGSMLKFAEETFNIKSLGGVDAVADDLSDMFDFTQVPRKAAQLIPLSHSVDEVLRASQRSQENGIPPDND